MLSILITTKNESSTIKRAISAFLGEDIDQDFEILIITPDVNLKQSISKLSTKVKIIQDGGRGKPSALNLALKQAKGGTYIFSDGDVYIEPGSIKFLLKKIKEGSKAVTGQPISINSKDNIMGFWSHVLVSEAHRLRLSQVKKNKPILISGYLFAIKRELLHNFQFPENLLTEDEYLSYYIFRQGHNISYCEDAKVNVKYSDNFKDWVNQKTRSLAGNYQIPKEWKKGISVRSFFQEASQAFYIYKYAANLKTHIWIKNLIGARLLVWFLAFVRIKILKQSGKQVWKRVESTKNFE